MPQTTSIVFVEEARLNPQPFANVIPRGRALVREFGRVQDVAHWVRRAKRSGSTWTNRRARLASLGGMRRLDSELRSWARSRRANHYARRRAQLVVGRDLNVWALLDGLTERNQAKSLRALHVLYGQGESPEALLGRDIAPHMRRLMVARELLDADRDVRARIEVGDLGLNPATVGKWTDDARHFEANELERALDVLLDLDRQIKTGETTPEVALELAIVRLCTRLASVA